MVDKEVYERIVTESQGATVEPDKEGCLWAPRLYLRQMLPAVVLHEADVILDIAEHLLAIVLSLRIGCDGGNRRE